MRKFLAALLVLGLLGCATPGQAQQPAVDPPPWWLSHVEYMTKHGGVWRTENPGAGVDPNAPQWYQMEWRAVNQRTGLTGRLYGLRDGREIAEYWTFREFWHPGERRAILQQWGGPGVFGAGESRSIGQNQGELDQTFWLPDGRSWREGHRTQELDSGYVTQVFDIDDAGAWTLRNSNTWRHPPPS